MQLKYYGTLQELTAILKGIGATGRWVDGHPMEFFMDGGGKVRWYRTTHTVYVQGPPTVLLHVTKCLGAAIAAKAVTDAGSPNTPASAVVNVEKTSGSLGLPPVTTSKPRKGISSPKFFGRPSELKTRIAATGIRGSWNFESGAHTFRASTGAVLKWFPASGALSFQGPKGPRYAFYSLALLVLDWPARPAPSSHPASAPREPGGHEPVAENVNEAANDPQ